MPPRLPHTALQQAYQCPSCIAIARRSFAVSAAPRQIGPESPRYIEVPEPPQQTTPDKHRIKGALPVPRDIFGGSAPGRGLDKAEPANIARATKEPTSQRRPTDSPDDSRLAWKERMAETRRRNLREGLQALKERRVRTDAYLAQRGKRRQQDREALLHRPEREDERLTNPTVDPLLQQLLTGEPIQDPNRDARLAEMRQRVADKDAARKEQRSDAIHSLYISARSFITTEAQLDRAIDTEFGTPTVPRAFDPMKLDVPSVWAYGKPDTVNDMISRAAGRGGRGAISAANRTGSSSITKERVTRIADELTGGRTDSDANFYQPS